ncbi:hypothetical protein [Streptomyces sp. NPDC047928]|uniref:hypothetical protein n=1 Tax=unclassified Streptomyces TaxID=2593676 RepID=UPI0037239EF1
MPRVPLRRTALAATMAGLLLAPAAPAAASANACTHHLSGPQICIRLDGRNGWNSITAIWTNPPERLTRREVTLYRDGERLATATAKRSGKTLRHTWPTMNTGTDTELCVAFKGSRRLACEHTRYVGPRA